jgi:hypothetical protein
MEVKKVLFGGWFQWRGEDIKKGARRVIMMEIVCAHIEKWNNEIC